jgi:hypothetical protein
MDQKKPWESKTVLLNFVFGLLAAVAMLYPPASSLADMIKAHAVEIGAAWSVIGIVLRLVSKDKIALGD